MYACHVMADERVKILANIGGGGYLFYSLHLFITVLSLIDLLTF